MVIPIGGLGPPLAGAPPPEVHSHFRKMKVCVLALVVFLLGKIIVASALGADFAVHVLLNSLYMFMDVFLGIWTLKDDETIGIAYNFLGMTCCSICAQQCPGGMGCLLNFVVCNVISVIFGVLLDAVLQQVILAIQLLNATSPNMAVIMTATYIFCTAGACIMQAIAAVFGWQAYSIASASFQGEPLWGGAGFSAADFRSSNFEPGGRGFGNGAGARSISAGRNLLSGGSRSTQPGAVEMSQTNYAGRQQASRASFQAFSGQGQRLGDG